MSLLKHINERVNYDTSNDKLKEIKNLFTKYGFKIDELTDKSYLSSGGYSDVYKLNDKWVLKITERGTISEVKHIVNVKLKHNAKIIFADELPIHQYEDASYNIYAIIQEFVPDSVDNIKEFLIQKSGGFYYLLKMIRGIFNDFNTGEYDLKDFKKDYPKLYEDIEFKKFITQVYKGIQELVKNGIMPDDVHFGNIRKDKKGNYKIIDF